jgi:hypothetical protein
MSEPEQNQKSENPHASFSDDKRIIERLARRIIGPSPNSIALDFDTWLEMLNKTMEVIEAAWPDLEKHFRQKFGKERQAPRTADTISNKINALACALHEVEKTVPKAQARYKTQSDDTKESIMKALSVLAFEARKECRPLQACQSPFEPKITDNRRKPEAEVKFYQGKDGGCYMSIDRPAEEKPSQKYPDEYYNLDHIANRITFKARLYPNLSFSELQKEIRADLNVLEEKL